MALREILVELGFKLDRTSEKKAKSSVDGLTNSLGRLKTFAIGAAAVMLTGKLAQGLGNMINEASDAAEIWNKFGAVFVGETDNMSQAMTELALRTGQSRIGLQELAADAGSLTRPLVGTSEATAALSAQMVEAALDISSFENVLPTDAMRAMKSAIIGSSEPMLKFGVDTRAAALQQFALSKGITTATKDMKSEQKTALIMELIMKRLGEKGAVGDATKTAGGFANMLRALQGAFRDLQAEIGKEFLPVATETLVVLVDLARAAGPVLAKAAKGTLFFFQRMGATLRGLIQVMTGTTSKTFLFSAAVLALAVAFKVVGVAATLAGIKAAAAWVLATLPVLLYIALMAVIIATIALIIDDLIAMGDGHESVIGTMIDGITDLIEEWGDVGTAIGDMLDTALRFWLEFFGLTGDEVDTWIENLTDTLFDFWPNIIAFWKTQMLDFLGFVGRGITSLSSGFLDLIGADESAAKVRAGGAKNAAAIGGAALVGFDVPLAQALGAAPLGATSLGAGALASTVEGAAGGGRGGTTMIDQSQTDMRIEVDATGQPDPQAIGDLTGKAVRSELDRRDREAMRAFQTSPGGGS